MTKMPAKSYPQPLQARRFLVTSTARICRTTRSGAQTGTTLLRPILVACLVEGKEKAPSSEPNLICDKD